MYTEETSRIIQNGVIVTKVSDDSTIWKGDLLMEEAHFIASNLGLSSLHGTT